MSHMLTVDENKVVLLCTVDYLQFKASDGAYCCCLIARRVFLQEVLSGGGKLNEHLGLSALLDQRLQDRIK